MRSSRFLALISCFSIVLMACWDEEEAPPSGSLGEVRAADDAGLDEVECIDEDGDGFGEGCILADCDDEDPEVTDACFGCSIPTEGCPCEPGTEPEFCKPPPVEIGGETVICNEGTRYCRDGEWTVCEPILGSRIN